MLRLIKPDSAEGYDFRGRVFRCTGKYDKSIADFSKAIELAPYDAWLYFSRADAYAAKEDYPHAIADYGKVLEFNTDNLAGNADVYAARGLCHSKVGDYSKGIEDCRKGLQLDTNCVAALNNLAWLVATAPDAKLRDGEKTVQYANRACELSGWKNAYCLGTLAAAYAEVGNFDEAVKWEKKCILSGLPEKEMEQAHKELNLFEQKKPYHAEK